MTTTQAINLLLEQWQLCLVDHHKDRDCHFFIQRNYSTHAPGVWTIIHNGYLSNAVDEQLDSFEQAEKRLFDLLVHKIKEQCSSYMSISDDEYIYAPVEKKHWYTILNKVKEIENSVNN